jgi:hypothetical protein
LSKLHKIFTDEDYSRTIKDNLIHFNSGTNSRVKQLNSRDYINRYIVDYYKYINNSKKTSDFDDDEKMDALMFYNVMYLLKNIYLKKQTILTNIQGEQYYVDEILFYDLPYIHMVKKDYDKPKKRRKTQGSKLTLSNSIYLIHKNLSRCDPNQWLVISNILV